MSTCMSYTECAHAAFCAHAARSTPKHAIPRRHHASTKRATPRGDLRGCNFPDHRMLTRPDHGATLRSAFTRKPHTRLTHANHFGVRSSSLNAWSRYGPSISCFVAVFLSRGYSKDCRGCSICNSTRACLRLLVQAHIWQVHG